MTLIFIALVWFLLLTLFVALKARQPKWQYPTPPKSTKHNHILVA